MDRFLAELRADVSEGQLGGVVAVFDRAAAIGGHLERMDRAAFDAALADDATDARALVNHDVNLLLGRQSSGTLQVRASDAGLEFAVDLPGTSYARDVSELVKRGDLRDGSFGFVPGADRWTRSSDGRQVRTHTSIRRLMDVSVVTFPAYEGTSVQLRALPVGLDLDLQTHDQRRQRIAARHRIRTGG